MIELPENDAKTKEKGETRKNCEKKKSKRQKIQFLLSLVDDFVDKIREISLSFYDNWNSMNNVSVGIRSTDLWMNRFASLFVDWLNKSNRSKSTIEIEMLERAGTRDDEFTSISSHTLSSDRKRILLKIALFVGRENRCSTSNRETMNEDAANALIFNVWDLKMRSERKWRVFNCINRHVRKKKKKRRKDITRWVSNDMRNFHFLASQNVCTKCRRWEKKGLKATSDCTWSMKWFIHLLVTKERK